MNLSDAIVNHYEAVLLHQSRVTAKHYRQILADYAYFLMKTTGKNHEQLTTKDISLKTIVVWQQTLRRGRLKKGSVGNYSYAIRSFLKYLDLIGEKSIDSKKVRCPAAEEGHRDKITEEELVRLFDQLATLPNEHDRLLQTALLATLAYGGLRAFELLQLSTTDIFPKHRLIDVKGKGSQATSMRLHDQYWELVAPWLKYRQSVPNLRQQRRGRTFEGRPIPQKPLWCRPDGSALDYAYDLLPMIASWQKLAGINDGRRITTHSYRHNFALRLHHQGATLDEIRSALRHRNVQTTLRYLKSDLPESEVLRHYGPPLDLWPGVRALMASAKEEEAAKPGPAAAIAKPKKPRKKYPLPEIAFKADGSYELTGVVR